MSMYNELLTTVKSTIKTCNLTEDQAVVLFIDVMNAVGWDLDDVDYDSYIWPAQERIAAKKALGIPH